MTPDRLLSKEDPRLKITQEALLNLSQIARECQINSGRMIANIAVPEISVFPVRGRIKSKFCLLIGGECFSFPPHWAETMGEQKINLLALFVETLAVKLLALKPRLKPK